MKIVILAGIPGSGKSSYARNILGFTSIVSADHWFTKTGTYVFNPAELGKAHGVCLRKFILEIQTWLQGEIATDFILIVDNTSTTTTEMSPYVAIAQAYDIPYEIVILRCDPELGAKRNTHGVPLESCQRMAGRINQLIKFFPGHWQKPRIIDVVE